MEVQIKPSKAKGKRFVAIFFENGKKVKTTNFGSSAAENYTMHGDEKRKELYLKRHKKRENWDDYKSAGSLSRYILWNKKTLKSSISDYLKKFKLKLKK